MNKITWATDYKDRNNFSFVGSILVNCSPKELWKLLTSSGHLVKVHPRCESHESEEWSGVGSEDVVIYKGGKKRARTVTQWEPEKFILLDVKDPANNKQTQVSYRIKILPGKDNCELFIQLQTSGSKNIPRPIWKLYARKRLFPRYKNYLEGLLLGFANYKP